MTSVLSLEMQQKIEEFSAFRALPYLTKEDPSKNAPGFPSIPKLGRDDKTAI